MMRDNYFSFMKGLAIIGVLFIHTPFMSDGSAAIAARQLVTFAVAMFFFLSGYFIKDERLDWKGIKRLFIPYMIWTSLWFAETTIAGSQPVTIWKIINSLFFGGAFFPLYFLIVLIELKFISPWIIQHIKKTTCLYKDWALLISPVVLCILYFIQYKTRQQPLVYAQIFPTWFIFYYVGALMKFRYSKVNSLMALCFTLFGLYLTQVESAYINEVLGVPFWAASQIKLSSFFYSLSFCILLISLHQSVGRTIVVRLGEMSFGIYLLHLPVMKIITTAQGLLLNVLNIQKSGGVILISNQLLIIVMTLFACYLILEISNRLLPEKINCYLGFR